jgi:hypothetical protein
MDATYDYHTGCDNNRCERFGYGFGTSPGDGTTGYGDVDGNPFNTGVEGDGKGYDPGTGYPYWYNRSLRYNLDPTSGYGCGASDGNGREL